MATIQELRYYPVKGCAATSPAAAVLTPAGLAHDRTFLVVNADGVFRSQRRDPALARVRPEIDADGTKLTLAAESAGAVRVAVDVAGPRRDVLMFGTPYRGIDQGDEVADWLSDVLGTPSRLVRVPPEHDRVTDGETPGTSGYADSCAVMIASTASLADLNARMADPVPMARFRPNIVVDGWETPYTEDLARRIAAGDAELGYAKPAIRCVVTTVDQVTGARCGPEPLRTLAGYRRVPAGGVAFGTKFAVTRPGRLAVGDELTVTRWSDTSPVLEYYR